MAKSGTKSIEDTTTHTLDWDFVGTEHGNDNVVFQYINRLAEDVQVTILGTYDDDDDFSDAVQLNQVTVTGDDVDRDSLSEPWDQIRFELVAQSSVSSTADFEIKEHR